MKLAIIILLLLLTACAPAISEEPTPTTVPLGPTTVPETPLPTRTPIPFPSPTPTPTPFPDSIRIEITPQATATITMITPQAAVQVASLNLREGPGTNYPVIGAAQQGDELAIIGRDAGQQWLQLEQADGSTAWASARATLLDFSEDALAAVPVVEVGPPSRPVSDSQATTRRDASRDGTFIFVTQSGGALYAVDADGSNLQWLTDGVIDPVLSPDGSQIAFTRWDGAELGSLHVINLDGTGERHIIGDVLQAKSPTWSPDGEQIVLSYQRGGLRDPEEICKEYDADDGVRVPDGPVRVTKTRVSDGRLVICYIPLEDLRWGLKLVDLATGEAIDLPADEYSYNPAWDPINPWRVIYDGDEGLQQVDVTNDTRWSITTDLRDTGPVFSPDGETLALTYRQHDHWEVYTYDLTTGERNRLTKPPILAEPQYNSAAPVFSPDGAQLAFLTDRTGQWEIWLMNVDGSNPRPMFSPEFQAQGELQYNGVNERMLGWTSRARQ